MGIAKPSPPTEAAEIARSSLIYLSRVGSRRHIELLEPETTEKILIEPHRVYSLGLRFITESNSLAHARAVGWRYFIVVGTSDVAAIEIAHNHRDGTLQFSNVNRANYLKSHLALFQLILRDQAYEARRYELRFLRVPGLDLNSLLWLKAEDGDSDVVIPLSPNLDLRPGTGYSIPDLGRTVARLAKQRMSFDSSPHPPGEQG